MWKLQRLMEEDGGDQGSQGGGGTEDKATGLLATGEHGSEDHGTEDHGTEDKGGTGNQDGRPDYISENFWDAGTKTVNVEALARSQRDLRQKLSEKYTPEQLAALTDVPADAKDYEISKMPEGFGEVAQDDPLLEGCRQAAKQHNIPKAAFDGFMQDVLQTIVDINTGNAKTPEEIKAEEEALIKEEKAKLGPNADRIINDVWQWAKGFQKIGLWSEQEFQEVVGLGMSAVGARALAKLKAHVTKGGSVPPSGDEHIQLSEQEVYAMLADPKYGTDAAYTAKVKQAFKDVFGEEPETSSKAGLGVGGGR